MNNITIELNQHNLKQQIKAGDLVAFMTFDEAAASAEHPTRQLVGWCCIVCKVQKSHVTIFDPTKKIRYKVQRRDIFEIVCGIDDQLINTSNIQKLKDIASNGVWMKDGSGVLFVTQNLQFSRRERMTA